MIDGFFQDRINLHYDTDRVPLFKIVLGLLTCPFVEFELVYIYLFLYYNQI